MMKASVDAISGHEVNRKRIGGGEVSRELDLAMGAG